VTYEHDREVLLHAAKQLARSCDGIFAVETVERLLHGVLRLLAATSCMSTASGSWAGFCRLSYGTEPP
jgi:hypothetical protein